MCVCVCAHPLRESEMAAALGVEEVGVRGGRRYSLGSTGPGHGSPFGCDENFVLYSV